MKILAHAFCLAALLSSLPAQGKENPGAHLAIVFTPPQVEFHVTAPSDPFLGAVILSLSPDLTHYFTGLPPILSDFVVLGVGAGKGEYVVSVPMLSLPPGILIYAQGLAADSSGIYSSNVGSLVLDAGLPD
jgi:hypothetical protein